METRSFLAEYTQSASKAKDLEKRLKKEQPCDLLLYDHPVPPPPLPAHLPQRPLTPIADDVITESMEPVGIYRDLVNPSSLSPQRIGDVTHNVDDDPNLYPQQQD